MQLDDIIDQSSFGSVHIRIVSIAAMVMFLEGLDIQLIGFAAPRIIEILGIPTTAFGIIFSAGLLGALAGAAIIGSLGDRFGRKPLIYASITIFALGTFITPLATSVELLVLIRFVASLGLGGVIPNLLALVAEYAPTRLRGTLVAGVATGQLVGGMVGGLVSGWIIDRHGWASLFEGAGILSMLLLPVVAWGLPESIRYLARTQSNHPQTLRQIQLLRSDLAQFSGKIELPPVVTPPSIASLLSRDLRRTTLLLWLATAANLFMTAFVIYWLPVLLNRSGMPLPTAIFMVSAMNGGGIVGGMVLARALDKLPPCRVLIGSYLFAAISIAMIGPIAPHAGGVVICTALAGFFGLGCYVGMNILAANAYPTLLRSSGIGWVMATGKLGSIGGPIAASAGLAIGIPLSQVFLIPAAGGLVAAAALLALQAKGYRYHAPHPPSNAAQCNE